MPHFRGVRESSDMTITRFPFQVASHTSKGARDVNQDATNVVPLGEGVFVVLADGLGGHAAGEIAARAFCYAAAASASVRAQRDFDSDSGAILYQVYSEAANYVRQTLHARPAAAQARTTCALAWCSPTALATLHVGDSRIYVLLADELESSRTRDHSVADLAGTQSLEESSDNQNRLYRSIGANESPKPTQRKYTPLTQGELILLCTDGVWNYSSPDDILNLRVAKDLAGATVELVEGAVRFADLHADNATAVAIRRAPSTADSSADLVQRPPVLPLGSSVGPFAASSAIWTIDGLLRSCPSQNTYLASDTDGARGWIVECSSNSIAEYLSALPTFVTELVVTALPSSATHTRRVILVSGMKAATLAFTDELPAPRGVARDVFRQLDYFQTRYGWTHGDVRARNIAVSANGTAVLWNPLPQNVQAAPPHIPSVDLLSAVEVIEQLSRKGSHAFGTDIELRDRLRSLKAAVVHPVHSDHFLAHLNFSEVEQHRSPSLPSDGRRRRMLLRIAGIAAVAAVVASVWLGSRTVQRRADDQAAQRPVISGQVTRPDHAQPPPRTAAQRLSDVHFNIDPPTAPVRIVVDGNVLSGRTTQLSDGPHAYTVSAAGYLSRTGEFVVGDASREIFVHVLLSREHRTYTPVGRPASALTRTADHVQDQSSVDSLEEDTVSSSVPSTVPEADSPMRPAQP